MKDVGLVAIINDGGNITDFIVHSESLNTYYIDSRESFYNKVANNEISLLSIDNGKIVCRLTSEDVDNFKLSDMYMQLSFRHLYLSNMPSIDKFAVEQVYKNQHFVACSVLRALAVNDRLHLSILCLCQDATGFIKVTRNCIPNVHTLYLNNGNFVTLQLPVEYLVDFCTKLDSYTVYLNASVMELVKYSAPKDTIMYTSYIDSEVNEDVLDKVTIYTKSHNNDLYKQFKKSNIENYCSKYKMTVDDFYRNEVSRLCELLNCTESELEEKIIQLL